MKGDVHNRSVGANDTIAQGAVLHGGICADAHIGAYGCIDNFRARANKAGLMDGGVLQNGIRSYERFFVFYEVQNAAIRLYRHVLVATVHPGIHLAGHHAQPVVFHVLQGVRELVLAFAFDVVVDEVLKLLFQARAVLEVVNADNGQIADEFLGLLHKIGDAAVFAQFHYAKGAGVFHLVDPNHRVSGSVQLEFGAKQGIRKGDHARAIEGVFRTQHSVRRTQGLFLVVYAAFCAQAAGYIDEHGFHLTSKVAHYVGNAVEVASYNLGDVFHQALHNGFARNRQKRLGRGQGVGTKARAAARHGNDNVHVLRELWVGAPKVQRAGRRSEPLFGQSHKAFAHFLPL